MKKWTYLVAACMLAGTTPVITGCVDTDEPAGIEQLRGAKAELLRAQAAVEQALVAVKQADAQYRLAEAALKQADADYKAQQAREQELKNDLQEAKNEYELQKAEADYQAYLEELARKKQYYEKQLEQQLATMEANIMQQKAMYEKYRQELEIAKITGDIDTQTAISKLEGAVDEAFAKLYGGKVGGIEYTGAYMELFYANKALQEAQAYQSQGLDCTIEKKADDTYKVTVASEGKDWVATLQAVKENAEAERDAASKLLADLETYGDKEVEGTDWKAEVEAIEAEIEKLQAELDVQKAQLAQAQATPEYLAALQAVEGVWEDAPDSYSPTPDEILNVDYRVNPAYDANDSDNDESQYQIIVKDGAYQTVERAKQALIEAQKEATFTYPAFEVATEVTDEMVSAINAGVDKLNAEITDPSKRYNSISSGDDFSYDAVEEIDNLVWSDGQKVDENDKPVPATIEEQPQKIEDVISDYEDWIAIVDAATIDPNELGKAEADLANAQKDLESKQEAFESALINWEEIQDIVKNKKTVAVSTETFELSTKAYNDAYDKLNTAITAWNTAVQKAYDDAYNAARAEWEFSFMVAAVSNVKMDDLTTFDVAAFNAAWAEVAEEDQTEEEFRSIIDECFEGENAASQQATFWARVENYVDGQILNTTEPSSIKEAAIAAVTKDDPTYFDSKGTLEGAITDAAKSILATVSSSTSTAEGKTKTLVEAIEAFKGLAASKGQAVTKASEAKLEANVLIMPADKNGNYPTVPTDATGFYTTKTDNTTAIKTYALAVNKIEDAEITAATATEYNEAKASVALQAESKTVFGIDEALYLSAEDATREWVEGKWGKTTADVTEATDKTIYDSYVYKMYSQEDLVEGYQNQIDASAELDDLLKELQDAKAAFEKTINDQYTANFGELETDLATANEDLAEKYEALEAENNKHQDIKVAMAELEAQIDAEEELAKVLREAAWTYLGITWPENGSANDQQYTQPGDGEYDPEEFAKHLQKAIEYQKLVVADAEKAVAIAEAELQKAQAEGYNGADQASLYVNIATLKYQTAYDKYQKALEDLQRAMDVLAAAE